MDQKENELRFTIQGMDCADCARTIEKGVAGMNGVTTCTLNFTAERLQVAGSVSAAEVMTLVQKLGYGIEPAGDTRHRTVPALPSFWQHLWANPATRLAAIGAVFILPGLILTELLGRDYFWADGLALVALALAGWPVARSAVLALRYSREININVLMTIAAIGAVAIGAYVEAGLVMVLFALGEGLEGYT
ncbi:MAG: cation-translocating P-type ATPase, partial [Anaerolineales bacterium]|nr:cation-translocating P-type ATPase [Anaerolineales bacterium]